MDYHGLPPRIRPETADATQEPSPLTP
jgi:hypothetical protein